MNHGHLIDLWPSIAQFARETDIPYRSGQQFRRRELIPYWFWAAVIAAAKRRGINGVTYEALAEGAAKAKRARAGA